MNEHLAVAVPYLKHILMAQRGFVAGSLVDPGTRGAPVEKRALDDWLSCDPRTIVEILILRLLQLRVQQCEWTPEITEKN